MEQRGFLMDAPLSSFTQTQLQLFGLLLITVSNVYLTETSQYISLICQSYQTKKMIAKVQRPQSLFGGKNVLFLK